MLFALDVAPWQPGDWPKAYATSPYMSNNSWLFFRFLVLLFLVGHFVVHLVTYWPDEQFLYFIYLSRWATALQVVEESIDFLICFWGSVLLESGLETPTLPVLVKVNMAMKCMVLPTCLLTSGLYWAFSPYLPPPYVSAAVHGGDVIVLNLSFFLGRFPYAFNKCGWITAWAGSYTVFTVFHFLLKIGTDDSAPCAEYPLNECPVYAQIDWHHPQQTALLAVGGAIAAAPLMGGLYTGLTMLRDRCDNSAKVMREATLLPQEENVKLQAGPYPPDQLKCGLNCGV